MEQNQNNPMSHESISKQVTEISVNKRLVNKKQTEKQYLPKNKMVGKWTKQEDLIYINFIMDNKCKLSTQSLRRGTRVFKQLSVLLNDTRTPEQCRMHHNKMKQYSKGKNNMKAIRDFLMKKYSVKPQQLSEKNLQNHSSKLSQINSKKNIKRKSFSQSNEVAQIVNINMEMEINILVNVFLLPSW